MNKTNRAILVLYALAVLSLASCSTTTPPPSPDTATQAAPVESLIDPRLGYAGTTSKSNLKRFDRAWNDFRAGRLDQARTQFEELRRRDPAFAPAILGVSAVAIQQRDLDAAQALIDEALATDARWATPQIYRAEVLVEREDLRSAVSTYRLVMTDPSFTAASRERMREIERALFDSLVAQARDQPDPQAIALLREALNLMPRQPETRLLLVDRLIAMKRWDEARRDLDPLFVDGMGERIEVQEDLVKIDVGRGQYQEAIARLERLARTDAERYTPQLEEIKREWNLANLPPQFRKAFESEALTRSDLAVLLYWTVSSVRFPSSVGETPIAVDISDGPGREELARAMSLRLLAVDPATREVGPYRLVTAGQFIRVLGRVLSLKPTMKCVQAIDERSDSIRGPRLLDSCGLSADELRDPDALVSGQTAVRVIEKLEKLMSSRE